MQIHCDRSSYRIASVIESRTQDGFVDLVPARPLDGGGEEDGGEKDGAKVSLQKDASIEGSSTDGITMGSKA